MDKIRVLVVDDTVIVRRLVSDVLNSDPGIEVVGVAANGKIALDKVRQLRPDLVTLDVEMPVMDGIETLCHLRRDHPFLPVLMFSTTTERGALKTIEALSKGATDYVTKPSQTGSLEASLERVRRELLPKVTNLGRAYKQKLEEMAVTTSAASPVRSSATAAPAERLRDLQAPSAVASAPVSAGAWSPSASAGELRLAKKTTGPIEVVVVGVSTGGPNALSEVIPALPADLNVPLLVVQHMPPMFTQMLARRLDAASGLEVVEGEEGAPVERGCIYLAPGGRHMEVGRAQGRVQIHLSDGPEENSCRPAVDVLMRSVAAVYGARALAVILTGMGHDGLVGCQTIVDAGGTVFAQDEASSVVWGMPGAVVGAGLACEVLPLRQLAIGITRRVRSGAPDASTDRAFSAGTKPC